MVGKKNLIPLLAIAFIVAILCTAVFYGLLVGKFQSVEASTKSRSLVVAARSLDRGALLREADVKLAPGPANHPKDAFDAPDQVKGLTLLQPVREGEPLVHAQVATAGGLASGIPTGMRAVSVRVVDAPGVTGLLRPGHKVDVQYVGFPNAANSGDLEVRTILQDMEVLAINPQQENLPNRAGVVVVTLLARPDQADLLSLADTSGRLRLLLRNPADRAQEGRGAFALTALLRSNGGPKETAPALAGAPASTAVDTPEVALSVQVLGVKDSAISTFPGPLAKLDADGAMQVASLRPDADVSAVLNRLKEQHLVEVLSTSRLTAPVNRVVALRAIENQAGKLRIFFRSVPETDGRLRIRVQPEVSIPRGESILRSGVESELTLSAGQSFLVAGLKGAGIPALLRDLSSGSEVLVVVTPEVHPAPPR